MDVLSLGVSQFNEIASAFDFSLRIEWYFPMITSWAGYFLLGYYLNNYEIKGKYKFLLIAIGIALSVLCPIMNMTATVYKGKYIDSFIPQSGLTACFVAIAFFLIFKNFSKNNFSEKTEKLIVSISKNTFGVYLIHALVNSVLFHIIGVELELINPVISIPLYSILVFFVSYVIVSILIKLPLLKKIVM